jgi:hypothetical protein
VQGLREADGEDEDRADQRPDHGHDLDQPDERPDEQPVVQADEVEAGRQNRSDREHHQESKPGVRPKAAVDREVRLACPVAVRLRCEGGEQVDDRVALGDAVPGGGEREEDRDDRLVAVRRDRVEELLPAGELAEVLLEPGEHAVSDSRRMIGLRAGDRVLVERVRDLGECGWHGEREEEANRCADDDEVEEDRDGLRDAVAADPLDAGPDRRCEGDGEEKENDDAPRLPDSEGEGGDRERRGEASRERAPAASGRRLSGRQPYQSGARAGRRVVPCGTTRPALSRASVTRAPKAKPPICANNATPPPFAEAEARPKFPSTSWGRNQPPR